jgi:lipid II:glycine glycyltransferase (peptidoglycan interpeptide bridge formation enzyme)
MELNKKIWNDFVFKFKPNQFLQSFEWGEFRKRLGHKVFYLKRDWGQALIIKFKLPFKKNYLYSPRGPLLINFDQKNIGNFLKDIKELGKEEKSIFFRYEPISFDKLKEITIEAKKVKDFQPSKTLILDLSISETEILNEMHYKTRYNIRLAYKKGVKVRLGDLNEVEKFLKLLKETAKRKRIKIYSEDYYYKLLSLNKDFAKLFFAEYEKKILAANIVIFFGDTVTYLFGGSSKEHRNLMAPHLLQWEIISQAKKEGYKFYDFWGIDEKKWPGVTRFKLGFGGRIITYPGTYDLVFNSFIYQLYNFGKFFLH